LRKVWYTRMTGSTSFIQPRKVDMERQAIQDGLFLYGRRFNGRLLLETARYESPQQLTDAISAADPAMLTVSLRRQLSASKDSGPSFWNLLQETQCPILPNTAGCLTVHEAVKTACLARDVFQTNLIKLEVIGDELNLQPDPFGLVKAANKLVKLGFHVLPYCTQDWVLCRRLLDVGCEALMPWAAPIGAGQGPRNVRALRELRQRAPQIPLIIGCGHRPSVPCLSGDGVGFRRRTAKHSRFEVP